MLCFRFRYLCSGRPTSIRVIEMEMGIALLNCPDNAAVRQVTGDGSRIRDSERSGRQQNQIFRSILQVPALADGRRNLETADPKLKPEIRQPGAGVGGRVHSFSSTSEIKDPNSALPATVGVEDNG